MCCRWQMPELYHVNEFVFGGLLFHGRKKRTLLQYLSVAEVPCTCIINGLCSKIRMTGPYLFSQSIFFKSRAELPWGKTLIEKAHLKQLVFTWLIY